MTGGSLLSGVKTTVYHNSTGTMTFVSGTIKSAGGTGIHVLNKGTVNLGNTSNTGTLNLTTSGAGM